MFEIQRKQFGHSPPNSLKSKSSSSWSISSKLFSKSSSSSDSETDHVQSIPRTPSPITDTTTYFTPKQIQPLHITRTELAHTPPSTTSARSKFVPISSAITPLKGSPVSATSPECCYCDVPLQYIIGSEEIVKMGCGHLAHFKCLAQLTKVLNRGRDISLKLRVPPCSVCDAPGVLVCRDTKQRFVSFLNKDRQDLLANESILSKMAQTAPWFQQRILANSSTHRCTQPGCKSTSSGLSFFSQFDKVLPSSGPAQIRCVIGLGSGANAFMEPAPNTNTSPSGSNMCSDNSMILKEYEMLQTLHYRGVSLEHYDLSRLRFVYDFKKSDDLYAWKDCVVYLFDAVIVLVSKQDHGEVSVDAVFNLQENLSEAKIIDQEGKRPYLQLKVYSKSRSRVFLVSNNNESIYALNAALHNSSLLFSTEASPIDGSPRTICNTKGTLVSRSPINFIVCIEAPSTTQQSTTLIHALTAVRENMSSFDRLGVVLHGNDEAKGFPFQRKNWAGWDEFSAKLNVLSKPVDVVDLDKALKTAERLLRNYRTERSTAALAVVSFASTTYVTGISNGFVYSDTPIYTIAVDNNCDHSGLDVLAAKTDGAYVCCDSITLKKHLKNIFHYATTQTHKNIEVKLKGVDGVTIESVEGWRSDPLYDSTKNVQSTASDIVYDCTIDKSTGSYTVPLGALSELAVKSFLVTLNVQACEAVDFNNLLSLTVASRSPLSVAHHRCQFRKTIGTTLEQTTNIDYFNRAVHHSISSSIHKIASLLWAKEHKKAYQLSIAMQQELRARFVAADPEASARMESVLKLIEQLLEEFSDKLFQPGLNSSILTDLLKFTWFGGSTMSELLLSE